MSARKPLPRVLFLIAVAIIFAAGAIMAWFQSWKAGRLVDLATGSQVIELPSGKIEYALHGEGVPVLVFHSAPGGYDQGVAMAGFLTGEGFEIVSPSRPGYLQTPLASGPSPTDQAEAFSWLLEDLEVDRVAVLGVGHGAPAAIEFARKFSPRISALVLVSAVTARTSQGSATPFPLAVLRALGGDFRSFCFAEMSSRFPNRALAASAPFLAPASPDGESAWISSLLQSTTQLDEFRHLVDSITPSSLRDKGTANDILQADGLEPLDLKAIHPPTLLVHGAMDRFIPLASAQAAANTIPNAELHIVANGGHLPIIGPGADAARQRIVSFLQHHTAAQPPTEAGE